MRIRFIRVLLTSMIVFACTRVAFAQCPNDNSLVFASPQNMTPGGVGSTVTNTQIWGGEYATVNTVNGGTYTVQTCGATNFDTQITVIRESTGAVLGFNDNTAGCGNGTQSRVIFTATFAGVARVLVDQMPGCASNGTNQTVSVQLTGIVDVEWLGFEGSLRGDDVHLAWQTANEYRSQYFIVERSDDATHFEPIGRVTAAGQSSEEQTYTFDDTHPLVGRNYYRISEVNLEGQTDHHADIVTVNVAGERGVALLRCYPNPASTAVSIRVQLPLDAPASAALVDLAGRLLRTWDLDASAGMQEHTFALEDIAAGSYLLRVQQGGLSAYRKVVIQR